MRLIVLLMFAAAIAPTTAPVDQSTPKGALKLFSRALDEGDRAAILRVLAADNDQDRKIADMTADLAAASALLRDATIGSFGAGNSRALGVDPDASAEAMTRIDGSLETIEGDKATVRAAGNEGPPMTLVRRDGKWVLPVSELSKNVEAADIERNLADIAAQIAAMRQIAAEVAAGKFADAVDARQELDRRIVKGSLPPPAANPPATVPATQ